MARGEYSWLTFVENVEKALGVHGRLLGMGWVGNEMRYPYAYLTVASS